MNPIRLAGRAVAAVLLPASMASAQMPDSIAAPGESLVVRLHAQGAQVYECKADASGKLAWQFREPIATLIMHGKTIGRHFAGPTWELDDGSATVGKVSGRAPGATPNDIPLLTCGHTTARPRRPHRCHNDSTAQHQGRRGAGGVRDGGHLSERPVLSRLRIPQKAFASICL